MINSNKTHIFLIIYNSLQAWYLNISSFFPLISTKILAIEFSWVKNNVTHLTSLNFTHIYKHILHIFSLLILQSYSPHFNFLSSIRVLGRFFRKGLQYQYSKYFEFLKCRTTNRKWKNYLYKVYGFSILFFIN